MLARFELAPGKGDQSKIGYKLQKLGVFIENLLAVVSYKLFDFNYFELILRIIIRWNVVCSRAWVMDQAFPKKPWQNTVEKFSNRNG